MPQQDERIPKEIEESIGSCFGESITGKKKFEFCTEAEDKAEYFEKG
jgi:hypothetical protein